MKTFWVHERPFDEDGNFVRLTRKEIEAMSRVGAEGTGSWRDGASLGTGGLIGEPAFQGVIAKDRWTRIRERRRTYHFANEIMTTVNCPAWLWASSSGTHYIKDSDGKIHIINKAWVHITITEWEGHGRDADNQITPGTV